MIPRLLRVGQGILIGCSVAACVHAPPAPIPVLAQAPLAGLELPASPLATWPDAQWWKRYRDPTLDEVVRLGIASAPSLNVAHARFDSARASVRETGAAVGARIDIDASLNRQRISENGLFPRQFLGFNWYDQADLGLQASYTFDWWGKQRATLESAIDAAHATQAEGSAAMLMLVSGIVDNYFGWQLDQARLELARERVANAQRIQSIAAARVRAEIDSADILHTAAAALAAAAEQLSSLQGSARLRIIAIAALAGCAPAQLPEFTARPLPQVNTELPEGIGIDLLARRADITASRWRVEAAQQSRASARADYYPDISIKALVGVSSIQLGKLLELGSGVPSATAAVHLPLFDAGRLQARYGATQAKLNSAVADYANTVIQATQELATQANRRQTLLAQRAQRASQVSAVAAGAAAASARVRQGLADLRPQLDASQSLLTQRDALLQIDGAVLSADIGLQRSLGGGYLKSP